jgi:hypothetical protein
VIAHQIGGAARQIKIIQPEDVPQFMRNDRKQVEVLLRRGSGQRGKQTTIADRKLFIGQGGRVDEPTMTRGVIVDQHQV